MSDRDPRGRWREGNRGAVGRAGASSEPTAPVSVRLPASMHDRVVKLAYSQQRTVSSVVRSLLVLRVR